VAVVLGDLGFTTFNYNNDKGFQIVFERTKRIKILKKEGYEYANQEIYLYKSGSGGSDKEKLSGLKAITHNLVDGKIVETKLKDDGIFEEEFNDNNNIVKFTFPNIKEGSIIEYNYKITSDFIFNLQDWTFQSTIPTVVSDYRVRVPEFFYYQQQVDGYLGLTNVERKTVNESFVVKYETLPQQGGSVERGQYDMPSASIETRYLMENAPAFVAEGYLNNPENFLSKINFELATTKYPNQPIKTYMSDWESLNRTFLEAEDFGSQINGSAFLNDDVKSIIAEATTDIEKVSKIYHYIKSNLVWDGTHSKWTSKSFRKLLDEKKGRSSDINLLLVSMLKKAGINAEPMLISTQQNGLVAEAFPISSQFNYVLCYVELQDKYFLLDATDKSLPMNILPAKCLNGRGYVVSESNRGWKDIITPQSSSKISATLIMDAEGNNTGTIATSKSGYFANEARKKIYKSKEDYISDFQKELGMEFSSSEFLELDNIAEPLKETHQVTLENDVPGADMIYFNPVFHGRFESNPFRLEERKYPVDFGYPTDQLFYLNLQLPDNYVVEELPQTKIVLLPNNAGKFSYKVSTSGKSIIIINQLTINKQVFTYDEYASLKEFFSVMVAKQAEQIVLKKNQ